MELEDLQLPPIITKITGQTKVPFGDAILSTLDTVIGFETCQELFEVNPTHVEMTLQGMLCYLFILLVQFSNTFRICFAFNRWVCSRLRPLYFAFYFFKFIQPGAEIIFNSSASHHELRKLNRRINLISEAMNKVGTIFRKLELEKDDSRVIKNITYPY